MLNGKHSLTTERAFQERFTIAGAFYNAIWWHALSKDLVVADLESHHVHRLGKFWSLGLLINLVVTLLALLNVWVSLLGFFCLALFYILPPPRVRRADGPASDQ